MSVRLLPAVTAGILAFTLAVLLFVPFVAREYRRRGELRGGTVVLRFAALLYSIGLIAYVLIPLPPLAPGFCAAFAHLQPQWEPLASLDGVRWPRTWSELSGLVSDGAVRQFGYNVALFVPLGMLVRYLFRGGVAAAVLTGFAVSLLVELTQLTGIWWLYPCPYRLFDVDDLIANTAGAMVGAMLAPLLGLLPGQRAELGAGVTRPVTAGRRLLGMTCDLLLLWWLGTAALGVADLLLDDVRSTPGDRLWLESTTLWFTPAVLLLVTTIVGRGSTLGQRAVLLRSVISSGDRPPLGSVLLRWFFGTGGLATAEGLINASAWPESGVALAMVWCTVHAFGVTRSRDHRGITGGLAGLNVVDARGRCRTRETVLTTDS